MGLRRVQLPLLKHLDNHIEASGVDRLDGGESLRQLSLYRDDEVQAPEVHVRAGWCARRTQGFILVRVECPYV